VVGAVEVLVVVVDVVVVRVVVVLGIALVAVPPRHWEYQVLITVQTEPEAQASRRSVIEENYKILDIPVSPVYPFPPH